MASTASSNVVSDSATKSSNAVVPAAPPLVVAAEQQRSKEPREPRRPGVWWKGKFKRKWKWKAFPEWAAEAIYTAFLSGEKVAHLGLGKLLSRNHVKTLTYDVDLASTKVKNGRWSRDIIIVPGYLTPFNFSPCAHEMPVEAGVWWLDSNRTWQWYRTYHVAEILCACPKKEHYVVLDKMSTSKWPDGVQYVVDLKGMQQINNKTGHRRPILIVGNVLGNGFGRPPKEERLAKLIVPDVSSFLLKSVLDKLISKAVLELILPPAASPMKIESIVVNESLTKGQEWNLYKHFRIAFEEKMRKVPGHQGQLLRVLKELEHPTASRTAEAFHFDCPDIMLGLVFYGSSSQYFDSILDNGMGLTRRRLKDDWFALRATTCLDQCDCKDDNRGGYYPMLLFMVILPYNRDPFTERIPIAKTEHKIPIAEICYASRNPTLSLPSYNLQSMI